MWIYVVSFSLSELGSNRPWAKTRLLCVIAVMLNTLYMWIKSIVYSEKTGVFKSTKLCLNVSWLYIKKGPDPLYIIVYVNFMFFVKPTDALPNQERILTTSWETSVLHSSLSLQWSSPAVDLCRSLWPSHPGDRTHKNSVYGVFRGET